MVFEAHRRAFFPIVALLLLSIAHGGCFKGWQQQRKQPISGLWMGRGSEPIATSSVARLKELGIGEFFLEVAAFDPAATPPLEHLGIPEIPPSTAVTLAISGTWENIKGDPAQLAEEVHRALREIRFEVEGLGGVPAGIHFDPRRLDNAADYASFLETLRKLLDPTLFLSTSLQRSWLDQADLKEAIAAVDFVVPFLYGQRVDEREDPRSWDFVQLQRALETMEEIGAPYMLGLVTLGTATHLRGSSVKARTTLLSLQQIIWNRQLKLVPGFSLEGVNRRIYEVKAERSTRLGSWDLQSGDVVRAVRSATSDLEELRRLLGAWDLEHCLGELYYRLPNEDEGLSLGLDNLFNALDSEPAAPDLKLEATVQRRTGRGWIFRFAITNLNGEITELSLIDNNFLQVTTAEGSFHERLRIGDFFRYDLGQLTDKGFERNIRNAKAVRLHAPILEGQQRIQSGDVELYDKGEPELELLASFLLPDGRTLELGPYTWRDGKLFDGRDEP